MLGDSCRGLGKHCVSNRLVMSIGGDLNMVAAGKKANRRQLGD